MIKLFIMDVDGTLTDGKIGEKGKITVKKSNLIEI